MNGEREPTAGEIEALVNGLLVECGVAVEAPAPVDAKRSTADNASTRFEMRSSWMSQVGRSRKAG